jgi:uncharacterized protein (DUF433 family)
VTALTSSEVVALFSLDERRIRKDVEYGVFGRMSAPRFELAEVVYLFMVAALGFDLGVDDRKRFYDLIAKALSAAKRPLSVQLGEFVEVKLDRAVHEVEERLDRFEAWKKKLVVRDDILGGEPVFSKSRLAVRQIGEMLHRGAPAKEIRKDYPYLKDEDIEFAKLFAEAYPRVGRPRAREAPSR